MGSLRRKQRNDFSEASDQLAEWYDADLDKNLIEASFASQYGIRMSQEDIRVSEYYRLLGGLMHDTPLGAIIEIRSETSPDILKHFSSEQNKIRNEWRSYITKKKYDSMTTEEKNKQINDLKSMFKSMSGINKKGGG